MGSYKVVVLRGDGIGPEVIEQAINVLNAVQDSIKGLNFHLVVCDAGNYCIKKHGTNLPEVTIDFLEESDACLKGPITTIENPKAPPSVTVALRKMFNLYANVRPAKNLPNVPSIAKNVDLVIVRENTEGLYSGIEQLVGKDTGIALRVISKKASERIAKFAFEMAKRRSKHLTYVHKANILRLTDGIFVKAVQNIAKKYRSVKVDSQRIDAIAMQLIKNPQQFDTILTTNMFGDIISDEAAQVVGGIGLAAGANIGDDFGIFEPIHGSAPKHAGKNRANPIAAIFSAKMMLDYLGENAAARKIESAVIKVLKEKKVRTYDLGGKATTKQMGDAIAKKISE
ncbi:TPA: isocitrate/isopropylmalate dehydrogenase family protein [archaeon]|uniref:Isocitrate/isopropylmalate dehydrogenase family protein n=1 Tax=Candidatus Naiadarchaeum limnaeum TaxID=2756139 RepID=A0A832V195_9ARCH|nr:isocitrate/isopropylmalate dehydrogenase family protein [Candidatus Naiadarchaeum limnaeum]